MSFFDVEEARPKLSPPIKSWREDMPENHEPQLVPPQLRWLTEQNDIYLEIPRYSTEVAWGLMIPLAILYSLVMIFTSVYIFSVYSLFFYFCGFLNIFITSTFIYFSLKIYFITPRDQPVRLNRKRQKIYIFEYNRSRLPWLKWPVTIKSYRWADVRGEMRLADS